MSSSQYEEQGVQFKVISPDMYADVMDFLWTHFFPAAPVCRSLGIERMNFIDKYIFPDAFSHGCSLAALDSSGNILAVRVGVIKNKNSWVTWMVDKMWANFPYRLFSRLLPPSMHKMPIFVKVGKTINFNVWKMYDVWNCRSVYEVKTIIFLNLSLHIYFCPGLGCLLCQDSWHQRSGQRGC